MRQGASNQLRSIARLRRLLAACRGVVARGLAARPAARRLAARRPAAGTAESGVYDPLLDLLDAELEAAGSDLRTAEDLYAVALHSARGAAEERDQAASALEVRHTPVFRHLGRLPRAECALLTGRVPRTPSPLACQVPHTLEVLRQLAQDPPPPVGGVRMDPAVVAGDLGTSLRALEAAMTALAAANADTSFARQQANQAFTASEGVVPYVAQTLEGLGRLAGRERTSSTSRLWISPRGRETRSGTAASERSGSWSG